MKDLVFEVVETMPPASLFLQSRMARVQFQAGTDADGGLTAKPEQLRVGARSRG